MIVPFTAKQKKYPLLFNKIKKGKRGRSVRHSEFLASSVSDQRSLGSKKKIVHAIGMNE